MLENNKLIAEFMGWKIEKLQLDPQFPTQQWLKSTNGSTWDSQRCIFIGEENWEKKLEIVSSEMLQDLCKYRCSKYSFDWNELMPVIYKLQSVTDEPEELDVLKDVLWWGRIEDVYQTVVELINYYNERSKQ